jgi:hypothetical protein
LQAARGATVISWRRAKRYLLAAAALVAFGLLIWGSDHITLQGERTIYTVRCEGGRWEGKRCTGHLAAAQRYGFRASPARNEVIYWVRGSSEPSGKYSSCKVIDRDNWTCPLGADQKPTVAFEMKKGVPTRSDDQRVIQYHEVPKWKWWLLDFGVYVFKEARS